MTESHRVAEAEMGYGDVARASGDDPSATEHYLRAAHAEAEAFERTPGDKPRTRGALGLSSVALFRKGGQIDRAIQQAHRVLSAGDLLAESTQELELLLDELRTQKLALAAVLPTGYQWSLRGGRVGFGVARLATVGQKIEQIQRYAWRVFEMLDGREPRTTQPVPDDVRQSVDLLVGQPVAGSFVFTVGLAERQLTVSDLERGAPSAEVIADAFGRVLWAVLDENQTAIADEVPDPGYREAFQRIVRNIAPDGRDVGEIEVRRVGAAAQAPAILRPEIRTTIGRRITRRRRSRASEEREVELRDTLRVIDLNRGHIALGPRDREQRCEVPADLPIVDMVAGLEDRPVRVKGHWRGAVIVVHDIEADFGDLT